MIKVYLNSHSSQKNGYGPYINIFNVYGRTEGLKTFNVSTGKWVGLFRGRIISSETELPSYFVYLYNFKENQKWN